MGRKNDDDEILNIKDIVSDDKLLDRLGRGSIIYPVNDKAAELLAEIANDVEDG